MKEERGVRRDADGCPVRARSGGAGGGVDVGEVAAEDHPPTHAHGGRKLGGWEDGRMGGERRRKWEEKRMRGGTMGRWERMGGREEERERGNPVCEDGATPTGTTMSTFPWMMGCGTMGRWDDGRERGKEGEGETRV